MPKDLQGNLIYEYNTLRDKILEAVDKVLYSGRYILGKELEKFEERFASMVGTRYVIGVGNGYDALYMSIQCSGILPLRVYIHKQLHISTTNVVRMCDGRVVSKIEDAKLIIPVVSPKTGDHRFRGDVIEDACQSIGMNRKVPSGIIASCYSFHPLKLLHCYGDGGAIATNDKRLYRTMRVFRNHGRRGKSFNYRIGINSRLDELQAGILNIMLDNWEVVLDLHRRNG